MDVVILVFFIISLMEIIHSPLIMMFFLILFLTINAQNNAKIINFLIYILQYSLNLKPIYFGRDVLGMGRWLKQAITTSFYFQLLWGVLKSSNSVKYAFLPLANSYIRS